MRSLFLEAPGRLSLRDVELPQPGPGELLVRVKAATTCGTDLKAFRRGHPKIPMPGPFGHEYAGVVERVGEGAPFREGEAVMGVHSAPCQRCFWCLRGQENLCDSIMETMVLGSFAEVLLIPERIARLNVFEKPDALPFARASLLEPLASVAQGVLELRKTGVLPGVENALVIGPGAIGLMWLAALRAEGIANVTVAGRNPERLAVAERMGARVERADAIPPLDPGYDLVVECTGQVSVWESSVDHTRRGGMVVLFGGPPGGTRASFDTHRLHYDQITLLSPFHFGTAAVRLSREWLLSLDFSPLITAERSLEEAEATFADLEAGRGIKYVFTP